MTIIDTIESSGNLFPSPIGVLYISIRLYSLSIGKINSVSVPYWGSLYFNCIILLYVWCSCSNVSVPYWGSLYFNQGAETHLIDTALFPSPIGVLYISINEDLAIEIIKENRFRPLLGFFIFQFIKH